MMRRSFIVAAWLLASVATPALAAPHIAPRHGPPDRAYIFVCKVLPRYGGGVCTSTPYAHLGARCSCEGPHGPRWGVVSPR
jgi:hypothetical protein